MKQSRYVHATCVGPRFREQYVARAIAITAELIVCQVHKTNRSELRHIAVHLKPCILICFMLISAWQRSSSVCSFAIARQLQVEPVPSSKVRSPLEVWMGGSWGVQARRQYRSLLRGERSPRAFPAPPLCRRSSRGQLPGNRSRKSWNGTSRFKLC